MKAKRTKTTITFTGIRTEGELDDVTWQVEKAGCTYVQSNFATKVVITGTPEQIEAYAKLYNAQNS